MAINRLTIAIAASLCASLTSAQEPGQVGPLKNGAYLVPTTQLIHPVGDTLTFSGRAIDLALSLDGKSVFVKYDRGVLVVDPETWKIREQVGIGEGSSIHGIAVRRDGTRIPKTTSEAYTHLCLSNPDVIRRRRPLIVQTVEEAIVLACRLAEPIGWIKVVNVQSSLHHKIILENGLVFNHAGVTLEK